MKYTNENPEKQQIAEELRHHLQLAKALRQQANSDVTTARDRLRVREWQAARLANTYADLLSSPRYGLAAKFFLSDLYGPKDFSSRDDEIERILPLLISMLPARALQTMALAVELDGLTEMLDSAMVRELQAMGRIASIDDEAYATAYRRVGQPVERQRQIKLIVDTGEALERLARKPFLAAALRLMHGPANLAGLGDLHEFLENGFGAFRRLGDATEFLDWISVREQNLLNLLFRGTSGPVQGSSTTRKLGKGNPTT